MTEYHGIPTPRIKERLTSAWGLGVIPMSGFSVEGSVAIPASMLVGRPTLIVLQCQKNIVSIAHLTKQNQVFFVFFSLLSCVDLAKRLNLVK
jgi:hypothetical protein